jgi:tRNA(Ile)-lysidine synthase
MILREEDLLERLTRLPAASAYRTAYSGGLDSHVLLHLCARLRDAWPAMPRLEAIHVNHGLCEDAEPWAEHCATICRDLAIPLIALKADARPSSGESPEEAARRARYRAFRSVLQNGEAILTAQHRDDQAETILLQLLRGAGPAGLGAMPESAPFGTGWLMRPLLSVSRENLRRYASAHRLCWIEDPSNDRLDYDRNFLRHRVMPLLETRWAGAKKALARSAAHCAETQEMIESLAFDLYRAVLRDDGESLSVGALKSLPERETRLVLRRWLKSRGLRMPSRASLQRIVDEVLPAAPDKSPLVQWPEGEVRRYRDGLFAMQPLCPVDRELRLDWRGTGPLSLPGANGTLTAQETNSPGGLDPASWRGSRREVRYRQGGESCRLLGRAGTHALKKLFQESGIPPWLRERVPLVYLDGQLAAVGGYWVCEAFAAPVASPSVHIHWHSAQIDPPPTANS